MLKIPDASVTSRQLPLSASSQTQAPSSTSSSHAKYAKNSSQTKNSGNTINLLKATSKVLAFLNPTGRKAQSSNNGVSQDEARQAIPPLEEQHLFYTQQTNAATRRGGRGHMYDTLGDADTVHQFKHIFQNRPINNQIHNNNNRPAPTRNDTDNDHRHLTNTSTTCNAKYTQQKNQQQQQQQHQQQQQQQHQQQQQQQHQQQQQQQQQPASSQQNVYPTEYSERDQQLAKEQLRMVRRNLRNCSPNSSYFRRYAALVDDWRNFLPAAIVRDNNNIKHQHQQQSQQQRHQNDKDAFSEDSEEMYSAHVLYEGSEDEDNDEFGSHRRVFSSKPPLVKKDTYTRTMPSTSTSMPSFVKELLCEEELAMLVSSAQFNSRHNLAAASGSQSTTWTHDEETEGGLFRNGSMSSTQSSTMSSDDTEANDAGADESYGPTGGRVGVTTRRNRVTKANGPRTRYARHQQRANSNRASSPAGNVDVAKSGFQQHQGRRYHELKTGLADKNPAGRRRSPKHIANSRHHHQQYIQQQSAHFGRIHLEGIVRGIESEFTLALDHDEGGDEESEDSLTYLVSGYENNAVEDDEEEEELISSVRRLHQATTAATQRESSISGSGSAASSIAESTSPQSTLLNSSDALSEASVEAPSPPNELLVPESSTTALQLDQPPKYIYHKEDQPVTTTTTTSALAEAAASSAAAAVALAKTCEATKDQNEKVTNDNSNNSSSARPSLKLQTHTMAGIAPGALSAFESRPLGLQYSLTKCNSTSSLYIDSTMFKSDVDETLRAVATVLYDKVLLSHKMNDCRTERIVNSSSYQPSERVLMSQADIFDFMRFIFDCGQNLGAENAIITLIYVERMTELGDLSFHAINWRRLLLGALILSIKVWEDLAVFNSDVCAIFEGLSVKDVNALERFSMAKLQYNVSVKRSVYAAYYFRLRDVSEQQYNLHYGKLTLSLSQRDFQLGQAQGSQGMMAKAIPRNDSCASTSSRGSSSTNNRAGSNVGLMGTGMSASNGGSTLSSGNNSLASMTHHSKVPVGPGYRKWTLKPLSVREADRLEARSAVYCSNMMMEVQERKDAGCCLDEYSSASPEELHNLSATLLAAASMHTISSAAAALATVTGSRQDMSASASTSSSVATMASSSVSDLATTKQQQDSNGTTAAVPTEGATEPVRRTLRLKKSRSDFFFQNTTPASIM